MGLTQLIWPGLALAAVVAGLPAVHQREVTIFDNSVARPTRALGPVIFKNAAGHATSTGTETVVIMPTPMPVVDAAPAPEEPTTTTTLTSVLTKTMHVAAASASASSATASNDSETRSSAEPLTDMKFAAAAAPADPVVNSTSSMGPATNGSSSGLPGVSYAPYRSDGTCKTQADVTNDLHTFQGSYSIVRIYGTDCNQVQLVRAAAAAIGARLFLGIFSLPDAASEANTIIDAMRGDWSMVHTVSVGNELVNTGAATPAQVLSAMDGVRSQLRTAGYTGPVVTVDTFNAMQANPQLCDASDYCAINAHAFFDSTVSAPGAGAWLTGTVSSVRSALSSPKRVVVTESGWPTQGAANGLAVPGMTQQKEALGSIRSAFSGNMGDLVLFSAFDDLWKGEADQYWGIDGAQGAGGS